METLALICGLLVMSACSPNSFATREILENQNSSCRLPEVTILVHAAYQHVGVIASVAVAVEEMNDLYEGRFRLNSISFTNKSKFFCEQVDDEAPNVAAVYYYKAHRCPGVSIFLSPCKPGFVNSNITHINENNKIFVTN